MIDTKILCTSPNCTPETLTAGTEIPSPILKNDEYLQAYKRNFRHIGRGLKLLNFIGFDVKDTFFMFYCFSNDSCQFFGSIPSKVGKSRALKEGFLPLPTRLTHVLV